jgi:hypothetical protein
MTQIPGISVMSRNVVHNHRAQSAREPHRQVRPQFHRQLELGPWPVIWNVAPSQEPILPVQWLFVRSPLDFECMGTGSRRRPAAKRAAPPSVADFSIVSRAACSDTRPEFPQTTPTAPVRVVNLIATAPASVFFPCRTVNAALCGNCRRCS